MRLTNPTTTRPRQRWTLPCLLSGCFALLLSTPVLAAPGRDKEWTILYYLAASDAETEDEHHLSVSLNGTPLGETSFGGKLPHVFSTSFEASLLLEGENSLTVTNLGDTGVYSFVFLDRFSLVYPRTKSLNA